MPVANFSGLASGIDSASLIDAIIEARELQNNVRKKELDHIDSENTALDEINTRLLALDELIDGFRTSNGGGVSKRGTSSSPTVATATVGSAATNAAYALTVTSVADIATGSFNNTYSSTGSFVSTAGSGNVTVTVGTGADQVIITTAVTQNSTTVQNLIDAINADPNASGRLTASAVNIGTAASPDYRLFFTTGHQGTSKGTLALSADAPITELAGTTIDQATDAVFSIAGFSSSITRSSNSISDVISGVTFQLVSAGNTTITIGNDADTTADKLEEIVDAYNDLVKYIGENDAVERVETDTKVNNVYGSLAKTRIDNDFLTAFRSDLSSASYSSGTSVTSMSELGISTNRDGTLSVDRDAMIAAINGDSTGTTGVLNDFADRVSGISGTIYQYTKLEGFIDIAKDSNQSQIEDINESIAKVERGSEKIRKTLQLRFANLEKITAELQSRQQTLSGLLSSL